MPNPAHGMEAGGQLVRFVDGVRMRVNSSASTPTALPVAAHGVSPVVNRAQHKAHKRLSRAAPLPCDDV
jgi:hypothetical protein